MKRKGLGREQFGLWSLIRARSPQGLSHGPAVAPSTFLPSFLHPNGLLRAGADSEPGFPNTMTGRGAGREGWENPCMEVEMMLLNFTFHSASIQGFSVGVSEHGHPCVPSGSRRSVCQLGGATVTSYLAEQYFGCFQTGVLWMHLTLKSVVLR